MSEGAEARDRDDDAEYAALTAGCGVVERSWVDRLEMTGADRGRFLQGLVTCDVRTLGDGDGAYGFFTSGKGRVLADVVVLALADRFWLELPPATGEEIAAHLGRYVIADRVETAPLAALPLTVAGPGAGELVSGLAGAAPPAAPWSHRAVEVAGRPVRWVRGALAGVPSWDLWVEPPDGPDVEAALHDAGAVVVRREDLEVVRVEAGVPRFGADFGPDNFPQETGLEERAVSYDKGCYLGQEVVARIHYRGGVQRRLRGLRFRGRGAPPAHGTELTAAGRPVGRVGSAETSPAHGAVVGLAVLHERAAPGTDVEVEGGGSAEVVELPFG